MPLRIATYCIWTCLAACPAALAIDGELQPFLGQPRLETQQLFASERFPNMVVTLDGAVLATWGSRSVRARRSEDGGATWGSEINIADPGFHGGGTTVEGGAVGGGTVAGTVAGGTVGGGRVVVLDVVVGGGAGCRS